MARNYVREAVVACHECQGCKGPEFVAKKESATSALKMSERQELGGKPDPRKIELLRRAGNDCTYKCDRSKPLIAEMLEGCR